MSNGYLEDRLAIEDLFVRYTTALDRGDVETIVDCFTPDGSLDQPGGRQPCGARGDPRFRRALRPLQRARLAAAPCDLEPGRRNRPRSGPGVLLSDQHPDP